LIEQFTTTYNSLSKTPKLQEGLLLKLTGGGDMKALRSFQKMLANHALSGDIATPTMDIAKALPDAINNMVDAATQLKNLMQEAGESFARPVNSALAKLVKWGIDKSNKLETEQGISKGAQSIAAITTVLGAYVAGNMIKNKMGQWLTGKAGVAAGVGEGLALQNLSGVMPVYVTNVSEFPKSGSSGWKPTEEIDLRTKPNMPPVEEPSNFGYKSAALIALRMVGAFSVARGIGLSSGASGAAAGTGDKYHGVSGFLNGALEWIPLVNKITPDAFRTRSWDKGIAEGTVFAQSQSDDNNPNNPANALKSITTKTDVTILIDGKKIDPDKVITTNRGAHR
jgi:hypothetical protein